METPFLNTADGVGIPKTPYEYFECNEIKFGRYYFPNHFRDESPAFHIKLLEEQKKNRWFAVQAPRGSAKAQPLDSLVLTPSGWRTIGELRVGDKVIGCEGKEAIVTHLHQISEMDFYKIRLRDGREMECNLEHLFEVTCPSNTGNRVLVKSLEEIQKNYKADRLDKRDGKEHVEYRYFIDHVEGIDFDEKEFHIDPYTLGLWLGDGHSAGGRITSADPEIFDYVPYIIRKNKAKYNYGVKGITALLRKLNLVNNKHIPEEYMFGSLKQREALLQGLIDTDGTVGEVNNDVSFCNINEQLIDDVVELVRSLGGTAWKGLSIQNFRGKKYPYFRVNIRVPSNIKPCRLKRKLNRWRGSIKTKSAIVDISYSRSGLGRCISVENSIYVTNTYFKTHNSTVLGFLLPTHRIVFKKKRFIIIVQNTYKKAVGTLEGIKDEIRFNERLKRDFGITLEKDAEGDTIFVHRDGFRTRVLCKGVEQIGAVRGERFGAYRPDLIIGDDMEDDEMVKSLERRQSLKDLYNDALIPSGDVKLLEVIIIGTILHDDSLMAELVSLDRYTEYRKLFYVARYKDVATGDILSLWPQRWTVEQLNDMERNKPASFAKEMQGDPSSGTMEGINREDFVYWRVRDNCVELLDGDSVKSRWKWTDCKVVVVSDMAWETKRDSDFTVVLPAIMTPMSDVLVDTYIKKKGMRPDEFEEIVFAMNDKYEKLTGRRVQFGFEKAKLEKVMKWFLTEAMRRRNKFLWLKDLQWDGDKIQRILTRLANRYAGHSIYHLKGMGDLENELIRIRSVAHDDIADALAGAVQLLTFAPSKAKEVKPDDRFAFWQRHTSTYRKKENRPYKFGERSAPLPFRTQEAF